MKNLLPLIDLIRARLEIDLPGIEAHRKAMPADRDPGPRYRFDELRNPKSSSVLIMLFEDPDGRVCFPLMERQDYGGVHSGQVSLPGGRREKHDSSLIATALRETEEELGVSATQVEVLGEMSRLYIPPSNYLVTPVVGYVSENPRFRKEPREVKEIFTVKLDHLLDDSYLKTTDLHVRGEVFNDIPYFHLENRIVWGATAMILSELAHILRND
jgi:8-oxo-dGTP pyrophosphatase MutT (NUDIX family)